MQLLRALPCTGFEHNDTPGQAAPVAAGTVPGLLLGAGDVDWFRVPVAPFHLVTVGTTFTPAAGDLDLSLHEIDGRCVGGRVPPDCSWTDRTFETGEEYLAMVNAGPAPMAVAWRVAGFNGATNSYRLSVEDVPWVDARACTDAFDNATCDGHPVNDVPQLLQMPTARYGRCAAADTPGARSVPRSPDELPRASC